MPSYEKYYEQILWQATAVGDLSERANDTGQLLS